MLLIKPEKSIKAVLCVLVSKRVLDEMFLLFSKDQKINISPSQAHCTTSPFYSSNWRHTCLHFLLPTTWEFPLFPSWPAPLNDFILDSVCLYNVIIINYYLVPNCNCLFHFFLSSQLTGSCCNRSTAAVSAMVESGYQTLPQQGVCWVWMDRRSDSIQVS